MVVKLMRSAVGRQKQTTSTREVLQHAYGVLSQRPCHILPFVAMHPKSINLTLSLLACPCGNDFNFNFRRDHQKNFLWESRLWVGRRKEPILGYVPKNDEKKNSVHKGLKGVYSGVLQTRIYYCCAILSQFILNRPNTLVIRISSLLLWILQKLQMIHLKQFFIC